MDARIAHLMKTLDLTYTEAVELMKADKAIDKGEKLFELSEEQKAVERTMKQADRKKNAVNAYGKKVTRERKADNDKAFLVGLLVDVLRPEVEKIDIANAEREFTFFYNSKKYKIVLSAPRS